MLWLFLYALFYSALTSQGEREREWMNEHYGGLGKGQLLSPGRPLGVCFFWLWNAYFLILVLNDLGGAGGKEPTCQHRRLQGMHVRSLGQKDPLEGGRGNPLQYSFLENPMDWGAWWAMVHRVPQTQTWLKRFSIYANDLKGIHCYSVFKNC